MNKQKLYRLNKQKNKVSIRTAKQDKRTIKSTSKFTGPPQETLPLVFVKNEKRVAQHKVNVRVEKNKEVVKKTISDTDSPQNKLPLIFPTNDLLYCLKCGAANIKEADYCSLCYEKFHRVKPTMQQIVRSQMIQARAIQKEVLSQSRI